MMKFVSAKYFKDLFGGPDFIRATGDDGQIYTIAGIDSDVPPWPEYLADGSVIDPPDPAPASIPDAVSSRQFFLQLAIPVWPA